MVSTNITRHTGHVSVSDRVLRTGQRGLVIWLTGLSGSGKSTLAYLAEDLLTRDGIVTSVLDGDNVRHGLCGDLGFTQGDRVENIRRVGQVAKLFHDAGVVTLCSFISPTRDMRDSIRSLFPEGAFFEVHLSTPIEVCEARDPKGLYKRAREGEIADFTGITAPYEAPNAPELVLDTATIDATEAADRVHKMITAQLKPMT